MTNYLLRFDEKINPEKRLFCFPYAGATAAAYRLWPLLLPKGVELCAMEMPGRIHHGNKPAIDMTALIDAIYPEIEAMIDKPYVLFGHSYGSIVAYEVARRLQREGKPLPRKLYVSGRRAPYIPSSQEPISGLPDDEFVEAMQGLYNAIPKQILEQKELLSLLLPSLRADMRINETYCSNRDERLDIPVTLCYGKEDQTVSFKELEAWSGVTNGLFEMIPFEGGHFFIDKEAESLIRKMIKCLN